MIIFKEKQYTEYEAMNALYSELTRYGEDRYNKVELINKSQLVPVLKGNSVVIEKFVITTSLLGKDKYRMYLKIGAKASLPDDVRISGGRYENQKVGNISFNIKNGGGGDNNGGQNNKNNKNNKNSGNNRERSFSLSSNFGFSVSLEHTVHKLLADAIKYDKNSRELVLEVDSPQDAVRVLRILPFGLHYKLYLLDQ